MRSNTFCFNLNTGWSVSSFPNGDPERMLALVFASPEFSEHSAVLEQLRTHYPGLQIAGCSTAGNIIGEQLSDHSIVVTLIQFDSATFRVETFDCSQAKDSRKVGTQIGRTFASDGLRHILIFSDGLNVVGSELVSGVQAVLPPRVKVSGGLAGDEDRFGKTFTIDKNGISDHKVVAVALYGEKLSITSGTAGGWIPFSAEQIVTRSEGNIVYELDGRSALACYHDYLGQSSSELPAIGLKYPLLVRSNSEANLWTVRSVLGVNDEEGSLTFAGTIAQGATVRLMYAHKEAIIHAAGTACDLAWHQQRGSKLALGVSCVGRRLVLEDRVAEELHEAKTKLPLGTRMIGFYSYGEICPHRSGELEFHNQSFTVTLLGEAA